MNRPIITIIVFFLYALSFAQIPQPTPAPQRLQAKVTRDSLKTHSLVKKVPFKSIGPTVMSGRVVDIEGDPENPAHFYAAFASGGLWESKSNGISFEPLFDHEAVMSIGDIAVDWKHGGVLWVGTGENNSSRSSYSGTGIYKSIDNGKTWQQRGLAESHHIGRILIHPNNPDILWIAALGHLYSNNPERGVFKTTDGGQTWKKVLFLNDSTGAVDLAIDPRNPDVLYAAMWERSRRAWNFKESGNASGIYKSSNGGKSWQKLNTNESGFPTGSGVGRIGLAVSPSDPAIVYALLDNQFHRPKKDEPALTKAMLQKMDTNAFLKLKENDIDDFLDRYNFPIQFNADTLFQLIRSGTIQPQTLLEYLDDANARLFDTPVIGAELYRSADGGKTWKRTHNNYLDKMFYTFGYYFGNVRVSPNDPNKVYVLGVPIVVSEDGGKTFTSINQENLHVDNHALWIDPQNPKHLICGNDGGLNITFDGGNIWQKTNSIPVGQFYSVAVDMKKPFHVYGGLQDNGVWTGLSINKENRAWQASGRYPFKSIMGGDGMQIAIDTRDNNTVYTGFQFGNYFRINVKTGKTVSISPSHSLGERPLRFNWQTPIHLSKHNEDILYIGSQKLHRSMDRGKNWQTLSGDLTKGAKAGNVPYGTLTTIHESPLQFGLIYTGSDDGLIYVTRDGGRQWQRISDSLPQGYWISRVQASAFDTSVVYTSLNGYRRDNCRALIFRSANYGTTWRQIGKDLPDETVNVIKEDPVNPDILYVGTDHGLYVSLNKGASFMAFGEGLPDAPVHDLTVHPRDKKIVVATHGRSLYLADVAPLQALDSTLRRQPLHFFPLKTRHYGKRWGMHTYSWNFIVPPKINLVYYAREKGGATISLQSEQGKTIWTKETNSARGLNFVPYDLTLTKRAYSKRIKALQKEKRPKKIEPADNGKYYLLPGKYVFTIEQNGEKASQSFTMEAPKESARKKKKKTP